MSRTNSTLLVNIHLVARQPNTVSRDRSVGKKSDAVEICGRSFAVLSQNVVAFLFGFRNVDHNRRIEPVRLSFDGLQCRCFQRVGSMRNVSVYARAASGVLLSETGNFMIVSPKTPRIPAFFVSSATASSK